MVSHQHSVETPPRLRIVEIVTDAGSVVAFMPGHLRYLQQCGYDVYVISSPSQRLTEIAAACDVTAVPVDIPREISPLKDAFALFRLYWALRRIRPHLVAVGTPKASLLGMLAARLLSAPVRIYKVFGLRFETCRGFKRRLLEWAEVVTSACAHRVVSISPSMSSHYLKGGFCQPAKLYDKIVSSHGVNSQVFSPRRSSPPVVALRRELGIADDDQVIGFVGRMTRDKGIGDLRAAFRIVQQKLPRTRLLLIGQFEDGDPVASAVRTELESDPLVILTGAVRDTSPYYNLMDVFAFPSYREGLPNAPLEAACSEIPTVGFAATGTVDAVVHGKTGWLVPVGDSAALAERLLHSLQHPQERIDQGRKGRQRALRDFLPEGVHAHFEGVYRKLLNENGYVLQPIEPTARAA